MRPLAIVVLVRALQGRALRGRAASRSSGGHAPGDPALAALAGTWRGSFLSSETGRSGTLRVVLSPSGGLASSRVTLDGVGFPGRRAGRADPNEVWLKSLSVLDGWVEGRLGPFEDPDCGRRFDVTFRGRLIPGDRILGTYTSRGETDDVAHGAWTAERVGPARQVGRPEGLRGVGRTSGSPLPGGASRSDAA